jgi:hypothetical protein
MNRTKSKLAAPTPLLDATAPMTEPVARIVEIFRADLEGLTFPDVSLASLEQAAEDVRERANQVEALRNRISVAEAELAAARSDLESLAQRGLAYAKVYATGNADLTEKLEQIKMSEPPKKRRRKAAKVTDDAAEVAEVVDPGFCAPATDAEDKPPHLSAVG